VRQRQATSAKNRSSGRATRNPDRVRKTTRLAPATAAGRTRLPVDAMRIAPARDDLHDPMMKIPRGTNSTN
jgi:hypothetical protein